MQKHLLRPIRRLYRTYVATVDGICEADGKRWGLQHLAWQVSERAVKTEQTLRFVARVRAPGGADGFGGVEHELCTSVGFKTRLQPIHTEATKLSYPQIGIFLANEALWCGLYVLGFPGAIAAALAVPAFHLIYALA